jgi:hypothetical protein
MKQSSKPLFTVVGLLAGSICLIGPLAHCALGLYTSACVAPETCCPSPPPGMFCNVIAPDDGSQSQGGNVAATADFCAYVYASGNPGWPCGGAVPDSTGTNCQ